MITSMFITTLHVADTLEEVSEDPVISRNVMDFWTVPSEL